MEISDIKTELEKYHSLTEKGFQQINGEIEALAKAMPRPGPNNGPINSEHRKAFETWARSGRNEDALADIQRKSMEMGSDPDGGYLVPTELDKMIESQLRDISPIRSIARVVQVSTSDYKKLVKTGDAASSWVGETESRPVTTSPQFSAVTPPVGEIYSNISVTQQLLDDSMFDLGQFIADEVADEFSEAEGDAFVNGNGLNKPRGFLTYDTSTASDSTRSFGVIQYVASGASGAFTSSAPQDKLIDLVHSLRPAYRQGAKFVMNSSTASVIRKMKNDYGDYIWQQSLQPGQPSMLLGYEVVEAEAMPDIAADSLSIAFGNFDRCYTVVDRMGTRLLRDPYSSKPNVLFYVTRRVGGALVNSQAIKLMKFSAS